MPQIIRVLLFPFGFILRLFILSNAGSRDIINKIRFRKSTIDLGCCIDFETRIDSHCHIMSDTFIANSNISSYSYVGTKSIVQNTAIGSFCSIANQVYIGLGKHPMSFFSTSPLFYKKNNSLKKELIDNDLDFKEYVSIKIGHDVWIGARAIVLDGIEIGTGAIVAANSVVTKDVPPYAVVAGSPARIVKYRFDESKIKKLLESEWWCLSLNEIKQNIDYYN